MGTHFACGRKVTHLPMSSPGFAETLRQLKLDLAKGTPVGLQFSAAGSRLIRPTPRPQDPSPTNGMSQPSNLPTLHDLYEKFPGLSQLAVRLSDHNGCNVRHAPAVFVSASTLRHHRYSVHHYAGLFNGAETDPDVYFAHDHRDQRAQRLAERQRRAQDELRHHALAARQAQPRQYRRHAQAHARSWQPKPRLPQQCNLPPARLRPSAIPPSLPAKPSPLPDPAAEATEITGPQVSFNDSDVRADHAASDAASAASTIDLVAALMTLVHYVSSALAPQGRRRYTKLPGRHTQETQRPVLSAATDRWPRTFSVLGRWSCAPRDCRKARSSMTMHHGCTDGTGTRPSFEPR